MSKMYVVCLLIVSVALSGADGIAKAEINRDNVVLRNGPGTNYSIVSLLKKGSAVKVMKWSEYPNAIGELNHYWFYIKDRDVREGWVYGCYIERFYEYTWYTFSTNQKPFVQSRSDWTIYTVEENLGDDARYSISLPSIWIVVGSEVRSIKNVTENEAEVNLYPGLFQPEKDEFVYNSNKIGHGPIQKLIYMRDVKHPLGYKCFKVVEETKDIIDGSQRGFSYSYFLQFNRRYFHLNFDAPFPDDKKEKLVDKIVSTFRFE